MDIVGMAIGDAVSRVMDDLIIDELKRLARQLRLSDDDHMAMITEFREFVKKWMSEDYKADPARMEDTELFAKLDDGQKASMLRFAKTMALAHGIGVTLGYYAFESAPKMAHQGVYEVLIDGFTRGLRSAHRKIREKVDKENDDT